MNDKVTINSRESSCIRWLMDHDTLDVITIKPHTNDFDNFTLDSGYTLTLSADGEADITYSVGTGITLDPAKKAIIITHDSSAYADKYWEGYLKSDSLVVGVYLKIKFEIYYD